MGALVPAGRFKVEKRKGRVYFYPEALNGLGIYFVAEERDGLYLLHDDGSIMSTILEKVPDSVDVVREMRFGSKCSGFNFKEGVVSAKIPESMLADAVRRLERFAVEVLHKTTKGLGE